MNEERQHVDKWPPIDRDQVTNDILEGETALDWLLSHTAEDWTHWRVATRGWKALRLFVAERAGSADTDSYEYRSAMTSLLNTPRHSKWRNVRLSSRTAMTRLADHIDQVDDWYNGLSASDKLKWKNPETVAEHCPQHLVVKKAAPRAGAKGKGFDSDGKYVPADTDRAITRWITPHS